MHCTLSISHITAANAIHGPDNHEEELIVRLPSYKAPSHGLLVDLDMELEKEKP
jgi:hypothetical protein